MEIYIDHNYTGEINDTFTEMVVYYDSYGWDSLREWRLDLEAAAENNNDCITEAVEEALVNIGYTLSNESHVFNEDDTSLTYKIVRL